MTYVAIVTGGTRGIGAAISKALHQAGYYVVANYNTNETAAEKFSSDHGIDIMRWDVGDYDACATSVQAIKHTKGPIGVLINNAGITRDVMFHKMKESDWHSVIATNLTSCFNMCHAVIGDMRDQGFGRIINISSVNALRGQTGQVNYCAAKAGVIGLTKALALENASRGITVNAIAPGYIDTDMVRSIPPTVLESIISHIPSKRLGQVHEIARGVVFLASPENSYITGITLSINGGQYLL